jgi:hypothetical protein
MVLSLETRGRVLVRLSEVTQELTVGIGNATASVRTLTDVSLVVRARELVVLSGSRGAGERAVLAVVAGDRRGVSGTCDVDAAARIRVMRVSAQAALALAQEWQQCGNDLSSEQPAHANPEVFLLDVVPDTDASVHNAQDVRPTSHVRESRVYTPRPWNEKNRVALRAWAEVCRMRGGAVIMAAGDAVGHGMFDAALTHVRRSRTTPPTAVREVLLEQSSVRVVAMHSGRLASTIRLRANDLTA